MSRSRFEKILRFLRFGDYAHLDRNDPLSKICLFLKNAKVLTLLRAIERYVLMKASFCLKADLRLDDLNAFSTIEVRKVWNSVLLSLRKFDRFTWNTLITAEKIENERSSMSVTIMKENKELK